MRDDVYASIESEEKLIWTRYLVAITSCCSLLSYGQRDNVLCRTIRPRRAGEVAEAVDGTEPSDKEAGKQLEKALHLANGTHEKVLCRLADPNTLPYVHVVLAFLSHLKSHPSAMDLIDGTFPWKLLGELLNSLLPSYEDYKRIISEEFPCLAKESPRPLPEDFAMRGFLWTETYFPPDWFSHQEFYDEQYTEVASMTEERKERVLWLGARLASSGMWLVYDETKHQFAVAPQMEKESGTRKAAEPPVVEGDGDKLGSDDKGGLGTWGTQAALDGEASP